MRLSWDDPHPEQDSGLWADPASEYNFTYLHKLAYERKKYQSILHTMFSIQRNKKAKLQLKHPWDYMQGFPPSLHTHSSNQGMAGE